MSSSYSSLCENLVQGNTVLVVGFKDHNGRTVDRRMQKIYPCLSLSKYWENNFTPSVSVYVQKNINNLKKKTVGATVHFEASFFSGENEEIIVI